MKIVNELFTFAKPRAKSTLHNFALLYAIMLEYCFAGGDRTCSLRSDGGRQLNLECHQLCMNLAVIKMFSVI